MFGLPSFSILHGASSSAWFTSSLLPVALTERESRQKPPSLNRPSKTPEISNHWFQLSRVPVFTLITVASGGAMLGSLGGINPTKAHKPRLEKMWFPQRKTGGTIRSSLLLEEWWQAGKNGGRPQRHCGWHYREPMTSSLSVKSSSYVQRKVTPLVEQQGKYIIINEFNCRQQNSLQYFKQILWSNSCNSWESQSCWVCMLQRGTKQPQKGAIGQ